MKTLVLVILIVALVFAKQDILSSNEASADACNCSWATSSACATNDGTTCNLECCAKYRSSSSSSNCNCAWATSSACASNDGSTCNIECCAKYRGGSSSTTTTTTTPSGWTVGKTTRYWDCCKPSCSWRSNLVSGTSGYVRSCLRDGSSTAPADGVNTCGGGGVGGPNFMCSNQQPFTSNGVFYGFAAANVDCCTCYELQFTSGPVSGKTMFVQVTNKGGDLSGNHFDLQMPGGGVGIFTSGCPNQFGSWNGGNQYGGLTSSSQCSALPSALRSGCSWRFNDFLNADNPAIHFRRVTCPSALTSITGCSNTSVSNKGHNEYFMAPIFILLILVVQWVTCQASVNVMYTVAGSGTQDLSRSSFGNGGFAINARFHTMGCMTVDTVRNILYICDDNKIRAVNLTTNIITTVAGTGVAAYSGTGISALQANIQPLSIAIHPTSNMLYVGDVTNRIRVINMTTGIIFDYAGTGINGNTGDNGPCASANIRDPNSLAIDTANNLLFFGSYGIVRVINISNNTISAFTAATGNCEYSGDGGPALSAFLCAFAIAFDNANNVYVAAAYERIRLVNRAIGNINTIMGNGLSGYSGDGGPASSARIGAPNGVAIDKQNNILFVSDSNRVIRAVNLTSNIVSTFAGTTAPTFAGDNGLATVATFTSTGVIYLDEGRQRLYIVSNNDYRVRMIAKVCNFGYSGATFSQCQLCGPGNYSDEYNLAACKKCAAGTIANITGATSSSVCQSCPAGSFSIAGSSSCQSCAAGTFSLIGQGACTLCPLGTYSVSGASSCIPCNGGYFANVTGTSSCTACPLGTYSSTSGVTSSQGCYACGVGAYSSTLASTFCTLCGIGSYNNKTGATSASDCISCSPGFFSSSPGSSQCYPCQPGYFSNTFGSIACQPCPAGSYSGDFNATQCKTCKAGSYSDATAQTSDNTCQLCGVGTFSTTVGAISSASCQSCQAGFFSNATGVAVSSGCIACSAGFYAATPQSTTCTPCALGYYSSSSGTITCLPCPIGSYSNVLNATKCILCSSGSYATEIARASSSACNLCPIGTYSTIDGASSLASCQICPAGTASNVQGANSHLTCQQCNAGYYSSSPQSSICLQCNPGTYSASNGSTSCAQCLQGTFASGYASITCQQCGAGNFSSNAGSTTCEKCPRGSFSISPGSSFCTPCASGSYSALPGSISCTLCSVGSFYSGTGGDSSQVCSLCPFGSYSSISGASTCQLCPIGSFSATLGSTSCKSCVSGTFADQTNSSACTKCAIGTFSAEIGATSNSSCLSCRAGTFADVLGSSQCTFCRPGTYSTTTGAMSSSVCLQCPIGTFSSLIGASSLSQCQFCGSGTYSSSNGSTTCTNCPEGTFSSNIGATSVSTCKPCPVGSYSAIPGLSSCSQCASGTYADVVLSKSCTPCPNNTFASAGSTSIADCKACAAGTFTVIDPATKGLSCQPCVPGTASNVVGAASVTTCQLCEAGTFNPNFAASVCKKCAVGSISTIPGSTFCLLCPSGQSSAEGSTNCSVCMPGTFSNGTLGCAKCNAGSFAAASAATECIRCNAGSFALSGASKCTPCAQGFFSDKPETQNCVPCKLGTFTNETGSSVCIPCENGKSCTIGTRFPLATDIASQSITDSGDPYFSLQKKLSDNSHLQELAKAIIVAVCIFLLILSCIVALILFVISLKFKISFFTMGSKVLAFMDFFTLKHFVPYSKSPIREAKPIGGIMTIFLSIIAITVIVLSVIDVVDRGNVIESTSVVPKEVVNITSVYGLYQLHMYLYNYGEPSKCTPTMTVPVGLLPQQNVFSNAQLLLNGTCFINVTCSTCYLSGVNHEFKFAFAEYLAMASSIEYYFTFPHFTSLNATVTLNERIVPFDNRTIFKGRNPTLVSLSLTTTLYQTISPVDWFFYNLFSRLFSRETSNRFPGYSAVRNPTIQGSTVDAETFWQEASQLNLVFAMAINPNANLIQQIGKATILDLFSKIFALIAAASGGLAVLMVLLEQFAHMSKRNTGASDKKVDLELKAVSEN